MQLVVIIAVFAQFLGTFVFIIGFFPQRIEQITPNNESAAAAPLSANRSLDRLVIMIIDAFSYEFVQHRDYVDDMPFLHGDRDAYTLFRAHVQAPTVTLPRIKVCKQFFNIFMVRNSGFLLGDDERLYSNLYGRCYEFLLECIRGGQLDRACSCRRFPVSSSGDGGLIENKRLCSSSAFCSTATTRGLACSRLRSIFSSAPKAHLRST